MNGEQSEQGELGDDRVWETSPKAVDSKYMTRRKFYVPKDEIVRDYQRHDKLPSANILPCDYEENSLDES
jgi:hypothetical protein